MKFLLVVLAFVTRLVASMISSLSKVKELGVRVFRDPRVHDILSDLIREVVTRELAKQTGIPEDTFRKLEEVLFQQAKERLAHVHGTKEALRTIRELRQFWNDPDQFTATIRSIKMSKRLKERPRYGSRPSNRESTGSPTTRVERSTADPMCFGNCAAAMVKLRVRPQKPLLGKDIVFQITKTDLEPLGVTGSYLRRKFDSEFAPQLDAALYAAYRSSTRINWDKLPAAFERTFGLLRLVYSLRMMNAMRFKAIEETSTGSCAIASRLPYTVLRYLEYVCTPKVMRLVKNIQNDLCGIGVLQPGLQCLAAYSVSPFTHSIADKTVRQFLPIGLAETLFEANPMRGVDLKVFDLLMKYRNSFQSIDAPIFHELAVGLGLLGINWRIQVPSDFEKHFTYRLDDSILMTWWVNHPSEVLPSVANEESIIRVYTPLEEIPAWGLLGLSLKLTGSIFSFVPTADQPGLVKAHPSPTRYVAAREEASTEPQFFGAGYSNEELANFKRKYNGGLETPFPTEYNTVEITANELYSYADAIANEIWGLADLQKARGIDCQPCVG